MRDELPERDERWRPGPHTRAELSAALLGGGVAGPVTSHDRMNVRWKVGNLVRGDEESQFGLSGLEGFTQAEVLEMIGDEAGFDADPGLRFDPVPIEPARVLDACESAGRRLAQGAERGDRIILATGHPMGLLLLYAAIGELFEENGGKILQPSEGRTWREGDRVRELRFAHGVAVVTNAGAESVDEAGIHTHRPNAMVHILDEAVPDLVLADHGLAGAAIEAGIETIGIADINDPALVVAKRQGRGGVIVMDDNVHPASYWPCFQAIAAQFT